MSQYNLFRSKFLYSLEKIIDVEKFYFDKIFNELISIASNIRQDFNQTITIKDFWFRYAPRQRGNKPRGTSLPWGEVGEKVLEAYMYKIITSVFTEAHFIGLPYGHDVRFVNNNVFVHLDIKSTGPTDNADEIVASPNQVTGDGCLCDEKGVKNSKVSIVGTSKIMEFQPELPPFYIIDEKSFITITLYLKCIYKVIEPGNQPLDYLELICVPNGLLMFETLNYAQNVDGLLAPGKDVLSSAHKRVRIKLNPLATIAKWRCKKIIFDSNGDVIISHRKEF